MAGHATDQHERYVDSARAELSRAPGSAIGMGAGPKMGPRLMPNVATANQIGTSDAQQRWAIPAVTSVDPALAVWGPGFESLSSTMASYSNRRPIRTGWSRSARGSGAGSPFTAGLFAFVALSRSI